MIVAWTGHRPYYFLDPRAAGRTVARVAAELRAEHAGALTFLTGGQRGVDLWAAEAGYRLGLCVDVVLPLPPAQFSQDWTRPERRRLDRVLERARSLQVVSASTSDTAYTERNRRLAEGADLLVAVWTGIQQGGTWETLSLARAMGKQVREHLLPGADRPLKPELRGL